MSAPHGTKTVASIEIPLGAARERRTELDAANPVTISCEITLRGYEAPLLVKHAALSDVKIMKGSILMRVGEIRDN